MEDIRKQGKISVHTENIFPIIKKSLYSNHEIFLRELVSNAVDANQKLKTLSALGEAKGELGELQVTVSVDKEAKTITISDTGIGMTAEEIEKYINQVAFSGAAEFLEKYEGKLDGNQIIGHFGLGFYSAFMVAEKVVIDTLSFKENALPALWTCEGSTSFELGLGQRETRGTTITLHIAPDSEEFLENYRLQEILNKYCKFLPIPVFFDEKQVNNTTPLWSKKPADLKEEDYIKFYEELYPFAEKPLFWIHLNVDYPFNLTGILYFPKIKNDFEINKNKIQLYSNQVFITDSVEDIVPDFLRLLHGVIDSPDIPLNVSRSFLQTDGQVKKITSHITKKVADKLHEIFKNERNTFEEKWQDLSLFVKYGMLSDEKFYEKAKNFCLYPNTEGKLGTWEEVSASIQPLQTDKDGNLVALYTHDAALHHAYIKNVSKRNWEVINFNSPIDSHFIGFLESKLEKTTFKRVDADTPDKLIETATERTSLLTEEQATSVQKLFENVVNNGERIVKHEPLSSDDAPVVVTKAEFIRRMREMAQTGGGMNMFGAAMPDSITVTINTCHPLIQQMTAMPEEKQTALAKQTYDLALLAQGMLTGADLSNFIERSIELAQA